MAAYVDAHCHLDLLPGIHTDPSTENETGIKSLTVTNAPYLLAPNQQLFAGCEHIRVGLGFHPEVVGDPRLLAQLPQQLALFAAQLPATRYVGEVGLDGSPDWRSTWANQLSVLQQVAAHCQGAGRKIISAHSRRAVPQVLDLLASAKMRDQHNQLVLHWFSGNAQELADAAARGAYFSVNHRMLQAARSRQLIALMPRSRVLTETDAPFSFDATHNTRQASVHFTIEQLGNIWCITSQQARELVWQNFVRLLST